MLPNDEMLVTVEVMVLQPNSIIRAIQFGIKHIHEHIGDFYDIAPHTNGYLVAGGARTH
jgi:hypothetical protein